MRWENDPLTRHLLGPRPMALDLVWIRLARPAGRTRAGRARAARPVLDDLCRARRLPPDVGARREAGELHATPAPTRLLVRTNWPRARGSSALARRPCLAFAAVLAPAPHAPRRSRHRRDGLLRRLRPRPTVRRASSSTSGRDQRLRDRGGLRLTAASSPFEPHPTSFRSRRTCDATTSGRRGRIRVAISDRRRRARRCTRSARILSRQNAAPERLLVRPDRRPAGWTAKARSWTSSRASSMPVWRAWGASLEYHGFGGVRRDRLAERLLLEAGFEVSLRPDPYDPGSVTSTRSERPKSRLPGEQPAAEHACQDRHDHPGQQRNHHHADQQRAHGERPPCITSPSKPRRAVITA